MHSISSPITPLIRRAVCHLARVTVSITLLVSIAVASSAACFAASKPTISSFTAVPASIITGASAKLN